MRKLVGRKSEKKILLDALQSSRSELLVVYGRRRVGKTFLVRTVYREHIVLEISGIYKASLRNQLLKFHLTLSNLMPSARKPKNWIEAFFGLELYLNEIQGRKKKVVFIDEFPWFDNPKSGFLVAFDSFWNSYVTKRSDIVVVVCGSSSSYMIKKIVRNRGGLHNRLSEKIKLLPFNLNETRQLLRANKVNLTDYDITQLYMVMGGVPHYLEKVLPGESVVQTLDRLCFEKDGFLRTEFTNVFASLFSHHENHEAIIRVLSRVRKGLTRNELSQRSQIPTGGTLSRTLTELEHSGFVGTYTPYQKVKNSVYRLSDEYSMFYIKFIEGSTPSNLGIWAKRQKQQSFRIWAGFSFETICMKHVEEIKEGLKIRGVYSRNYSWIEKNTENSAQIDLLIDRDDNVINLCEIKFHNTPYAISKTYASEVTKKMNSFSESTNTRKSIFITFITTYGLVENQYKRELVQNELKLADLFVALKK